MADKIAINIVDRSVSPDNPVNIAIVNLPNPVIGYEADSDQTRKLIQIPKYFITDSYTGKIVNGRTYYDYFPEKKPGPGPGPGPSPSTDTKWYGFAKPKITAVPGTVVTTIERS
jgi:hypothetical protein